MAPNSCKELRAVVNNFIGNNVRDSSAMQIGSLESGEIRKEEQAEEGFDGDLNALKGKGKGKGKCFNCGGAGHIAANCPSPQQKGGGKGGKGPKGGAGGMGKGFGKGGKGPAGGCWHCGGKHYAADCPKGKGKGKLGWFEAPESDWDYSTEDGSLKYLSSLTLKGAPLRTSNYWSDLQAEEEKVEPTGVLGLAGVALSDAGHVCGTSVGSAEGPGLTGGVLNAAGVGLDLSSRPKGGRHVKAEGALSASCHSVSISRGKGNDLAQEFSPPPAAIDGADLVAAARKR